MMVYFLRHGLAESGAGISDEQRSLTDEGRAKVKALLERAAAAIGEPDLILTSPLRRAVQTGEIAAQILGYDGAFERTQALTPESPALEVWQEIRMRRDREKLLLISHQPLIGDAVSCLLGVSGLSVSVSPGALFAIRIDAFGTRPSGVLRWMLSPELLG